jgi:hypothetical protein
MNKKYWENDFCIGHLYFSVEDWVALCSLLLTCACHGAPKNCEPPLSGTKLSGTFVQALHISSIKPSCKAEECKCAKHYFLKNNWMGT